MEREVKGSNCEVISSTFDEPATRHVQVSEMVLEKAKNSGKKLLEFIAFVVAKSDKTYKNLKLSMEIQKKIDF